MSDSDYRGFDDHKLTTEEKAMMLYRLNEFYRMLITVLTVRCGGEVVIKHDELDHTRRNYLLSENIGLEDMTCDMRLRVRLK